MKTLLLVSSITAACYAQQVVTPTQAPVGPPKGDNVSDYNIVDSFETGYRWTSVGGDPEEYKSQVNYADGVRLLGSSLSMFSRDGHGKYFDELTLSTVGLGGDPYESATLRIAKNNLYRFDMSWRLNDYYNPGLVSAGQQSGNFRDTQYTSLDNDLVLFPQSKIKFFLGYSRQVQEGPEITNVGGFLASPQTPAIAGQDTVGIHFLARRPQRIPLGQRISALGSHCQLDARMGGFQGRFSRSSRSDKRCAHLAIRKPVSRHQPLLARGTFLRPEMVQREWPLYLYRNAPGLCLRPKSVPTGIWSEHRAVSSGDYGNRQSACRHRQFERQLFSNTQAHPDQQHRRL